MKAILNVSFLIIFILSLSNAKKLKQSWDNQLEKLIASAAGAAISKATFINLDGGAVLVSANFPKSIQISPAEGVKIAQMMKSGDFTSAQANGILLEGVKYQFLRDEGKVVYAKKKDNGSITIQKTKSLVIIAKTPEGAQQGNTNAAVSTFADLLESQGL